jgi:hypothetical protein
MGGLDERRAPNLPRRLGCDSPSALRRGPPRAAREDRPRRARRPRAIRVAASTRAISSRLRLPSIESARSKARRRTAGVGRRWPRSK